MRAEGETAASSMTATRAATAAAAWARASTLASVVPSFGRCFAIGSVEFDCFAVTLRFGASFPAVAVSRGDLEDPDLEGPDLEGPDLEGPDLEGPDLESRDLES